MREYLEDVCWRLGEALRDVRPIALRVDCENVSIDSRQAIRVGLIVNELATNALKHAFPDDRGGAIYVKLRQRPADLIVVVGGAYRGVTTVLDGVSGAVSSTAQTAAQAAGPSVSHMTDPFSSIEQSLRSAVPGNDPAALRDVAIAAMRAAVTGDQQQAAQARERAAQAISRAQNISIDDARKQVRQHQQQYRQAVDQAKRQATQAADTAAKTVSGAALPGFISLLLGAVAGWFGGRMSAVEPLQPGPHQHLHPAFLASLPGCASPPRSVPGQPRVIST